MASARSVVWASADEEFVRRIMELGQDDTIPVAVCMRYEKLQATFHRAIHTGPIEPLVLLIMVVGMDDLPGKRVIESSLARVPIGTWVVVKRGSTVIRGTFQGLKAPPLDSIAVVWAEDTPEMEMAFPDHMLEIVREQERPEVVPLSDALKSPKFDPLESIGDAESAQSSSVMSTPTGFAWKEVAPETPVSVAMEDGSMADGKFVRQTDDGRLSIRLASGGRARMFLDEQVKLVTDAPLEELLSFGTHQGK